jgi:hypothetical protein
MQVEVNKIYGPDPNGYFYKLILKNDIWVVLASKSKKHIDDGFCICSKTYHYKHLAQQFIKDHINGIYRELTANCEFPPKD